MNIIVVDDTQEVPAQIKKYADLKKMSAYPLLIAWQNFCLSESLTIPSRLNEEILFDMRPMPEKAIKKKNKISYIKQQRLLPKFLRWGFIKSLAKITIAKAGVVNNNGRMYTTGALKNMTRETLIWDEKDKKLILRREITNKEKELLNESR